MPTQIDLKPAKPVMRDKRRTTRFDLNLPATVELTPGEETAFASTVNLSERGLCLLSKEKIAEGSRLLCRLLLEGGERFVLQGKVMWSAEWPVLITTEYKMGVWLSDAVNSSFGSYEKFCRQRLKNINK